MSNPTTTVRYLPTAFSALGTGVVWASGQAAVSGSVADWASCIVASGRVTNTLVFRGFGISIPDRHGIVGARVYVTGNYDCGIGNIGTMHFSLHNGINNIGTVENKTLLPFNLDTTFSNPSSKYIVNPSDVFWGTNLSLTNTLLAASGFGVAVSGFHRPAGDFPDNTGTFRIASVALELDYQPIAVVRKGGSTISRLGGTFRKE